MFEESYRRITVRLRDPDAEFLKHHPNKGVSEELFNQIAEKFPQYLVYSRIEITQPFGHPDLKALLEMAEDLQLNIEPHRGLISQVDIVDYRRWSAEEVESADYLEADLYKPTFDSMLDADVTLVSASDKELKRRARTEFGSTTNLPHLIYVRGSAKKKLEAAGLVGLKLERVPTNREGGEWPEGVEPIYLVRSTVEFPHTDMMVFDDNENVQSTRDCDWGNTRTRWYRIDGYEMHPQLRYRSPLPEVDVALSKEHFGGAGWYSHRVIYSQKAKAVLEEIGMKLICTPVRVEPSV